MQVFEEFLAKGHVDVLGQESLILVEPENEQIRREGKYEKCFTKPGAADFRDTQSEHPVQHYGSDHEPDINRLSPRIEQKRKAKQYNIADGAPGCDEIDREEGGEEGKEEYSAREYHYVDRFFPVSRIRIRRFGLSRISCDG